MNKDPRRVAARYGRGRLSGHWHVITDFGPPVPGSFDVNEGGAGVIHVHGNTIRWEPWLRGGRTFSVQDVKGVIIAPGIGHCVLCDTHDQTLAVFCMSYRNGELFVKYLKSHSVPFYRLTEVSPTGPIAPKRPQEPEEARHTDLPRYSSPFPEFTLELRRTLPILGLVGGGLVLGLMVFFVGFPVIALHGGPHEDLYLNIMVALSIFLIAGPWVLAAAKGELFPPRLSVEYGHIWLDRGFYPLREIRLEEIGGLRWDRSDECYILFDQNGKTLAKFSTRDPSGPQFMNFLTDHNIRIRAEK